MTDALGTLETLVTQFGSPDTGTVEGRAAANFLATEHGARAHAVMDGARNGQLTASEQRTFEFHVGQARQLRAAAELYGSREADVAATVVATGGGEGRSAGGAMHIGGGRTYERGNRSGPSWVKDMAAFALRGDPDAAGRLNRNMHEVEVEHRAMSSTDGAGGDFVPPAWFVEQYATVARAARVTANLMHQESLPRGTDSISIPKVLTGTAVAEQGTQNTAVQQTDATTGKVTADVTTLAGGQTVSLQMIEQSPIDIDQMLLTDLLADLSSKTNLFVLSNNAANKKGLLAESGTNAITYTDASPTVGELYSKLADARQQVDTGRFFSADAIVMHPRRWAWMLAAADTQNRPLIVPTAQGPNNAAGTYSGPTNTSTGLAGTLLGLPVYLDPLIPINLGAGTNEDRILVMRTEDQYLWEGVPRAESFRETKADQLSVFLRVYNYVAFTAARYPKSVSIIAGTGLVTPTF